MVLAPLTAAEEAVADKAVGTISEFILTRKVLVVQPDKIEKARAQDEGTWLMAEAKITQAAISLLETVSAAPRKPWHLSAGSSGSGDCLCLCDFEHGRWNADACLRSECTLTQWG